MSWIKNTITFVISCVLTVLLIEGLLRFFPVMDVSRTMPLASSSRAFDVAAQRNSELVHSSEWDFKNALMRRTNNYGFFSNYDYEKLFSGWVVIGDSFVEARQVSFDKTFHQALASKLNQPVYNVGLSGAPLSQYEAYAKEVCEEFSPKGLIFTIIANDFDESFIDNRVRSGFFHYGDGDVLAATPYSISFLRSVANRSSLVRYLYFHLGLGAILSNQGNQSEGVATLASNQKVSELNQLATERFLQSMSQICVPAKKIVFVLDANRYVKPASTIYTENPERLEKMEQFKSMAKSAGFKVVDMQAAMLKAHQESRVKFEFSFDYHWNESGHALVAQELWRAVSGIDE